MPKYVSESDDSEREYEEVQKKHKKSKRHKELKKRKRDSSEERKKSKKHKKKHKEQSPHSSSSPVRYDPHRQIKTEPASDIERPERKRRADHRHKSNSPVRYDPHRQIKRESMCNTDRPERDRRRPEQERQRNDRRRQEDRPRKTEEMQADLNNVKKEPPKKKKPDLGLSGKLTEDTNTYNGVVIQYNEPSEARKPKRRWRLYIFKGDSMLPVLYVHRQSAYLLGRDRRVADIPIDHPSCSKQHAVFQYRLVPYTRNNGTVGKRVRPYIIDLDSANGTYLNNNKIDSRRYVELIEKDVLKFGYSSREYVLLHEESKESSEDED